MLLLLIATRMQVRQGCKDASPTKGIREEQKDGSRSKTQRKQGIKLEIFKLFRTNYFELDLFRSYGVVG